jgi:hypothetical protein
MVLLSTPPPPTPLLSPILASFIVGVVDGALSVAPLLALLASASTFESRPSTDLAANRFLFRSLVVVAAAAADEDLVDMD